MSKSSNYRTDFRAIPADPLNALLDIAAAFIPPAWPKGERPAFVGDPAELGSMIGERTLPEVMVVAEFVAYLPSESGDLKTSFRRFVWLQARIDEDISTDVRARLVSTTWRN